MKVCQPTLRERREWELGGREKGERNVRIEESARTKPTQWYSSGAVSIMNFTKNFPIMNTKC